MHHPGNIISLIFRNAICQKTATHATCQKLPPIVTDYTKWGWVPSSSTGPHTVYGKQIHPTRAKLNISGQPTSRGNLYGGNGILFLMQEVSIPRPPGPMIWGLHSSPDCYEGLVSYSWTNWSNLGAISSLSSFLEWTIAKAIYWHKCSFPSYQLPSDIGGHARDNPILERLGTGHFIARGFF